jgi:2-polyprenyl-3-methyl-5-hydroxy-6-metoxy-1,4-benzoquinol methylase
MEQNGLFRFKSEAWKSHKMAQSYSTNVNLGSNLAKYNLSVYLKYVVANISKSDRILDIGAGTGALTIPLAKDGYNVDALDISAAMMVYIAREVPHVTLIEADLFELSGIQDKYNVIVSRWVLPHFPNYSQILEQLQRLLAPGGRIIFDMPNGSQFNLVSSLSRYKKMDKNLFGYDHQISANNENFYACATNSEITTIAMGLGMRMQKRSFFGFFTNSLLIAVFLGNLNYGRLKRLMEKIFNGPVLGVVVFKSLNSLLTFILPSIFFHSSIVVLDSNHQSELLDNSH